ncbi:MAG: sulfotransferase domain-containing protein [Microcoleaceae cyanobacterium MO_207.B10]|nr:sulfotransferase domain-containing protein [Microcoleaceae cyanobacterium MO_207.B10]
MKQLIKSILYKTYPIFKSKPDLLIIGAQRSGVTSLYKYLIQHPQTLVTWNWRETYYFDVDENYNKGIGWYLRHFPWKLQKGNKLTFEAPPSYLYHSYIPERIQHDLGNIKMISILRNPADRAYSAWQMFHSYSSNSLSHLRERADERSFAEAIEQELNPESNQAKYPYDYVERGKYVYQLKNYYQYFDRDNILVLNFEDFCDNLGSVLNQVTDFLGIEKYSPEMIKELQQQKYAVAKYIKSPGDEEVIERLKNYFVPTNEELYNLLGCRYNW